jgi:hypothetical protein
MKLPDTVILNKQKIKVLTPNGYENFLGVNKIVEDQYIHLIFEDDNELKCSLDHPILTIEGIIKAKDLDKTTEVITKEGGTFLKSYNIIKEKIELYDIVNSGTDHLYYSNNIVSHNCEFLGSVDTLISGAKLSNLIQEEPIKSHAGLDIYEHPKKDHQYIITVDVARGVEIDYSAFAIVDITELPYKMVGKYRSNEIKPIVFPYIINDSAKAYNNAHVLCEVNDVGDQVAAGLHYDLEYPNLLMCSMRGRAGQVLGQGFSGMKVQLGLKMSKNTKKVGCFNLKALIEEDKLIIPDYDTIVELTTFVQKYNTFQAEEGCNDDLVMTLVLLAWVVCQDYFKEMTNTDIRAKLYEEKQNQLDQDMSPFGFIIDGTEGDNEFAVEADSMNVRDRWMRIKKSDLGNNPDIIDLYPEPVDEYGSMQYMVDYIY